MCSKKGYENIDVSYGLLLPIYLYFCPFSFFSVSFLLLVFSHLCPSLSVEIMCKTGHRVIIVHVMNAMNISAAILKHDHSRLTSSPPWYISVKARWLNISANSERPARMNVMITSRVMLIMSCSPSFLSYRAFFYLLFSSVLSSYLLVSSVMFLCHHFSSGIHHVSSYTAKGQSFYCYTEENNILNSLIYRAFKSKYHVTKNMKVIPFRSIYYPYNDT